MTTILLRTLIIYFALLLTMRLMGKRQIGELEVTDLVTTLLISEIASLPVTNQDIPVSYALIPILTLLFLEVAFSVIPICFPKLKNLVSTRPTVLVNHGLLDQRALRNMRITIDELMCEIRQQGISDLSQVAFAILEKNGKLTVLPKTLYAQPDAEQLGLHPAEGTLMHIVYSNGCFSRAGLSTIGKDRAWLERQLGRRGLTARELFCVTADEKGSLYYIRKEEK